MIAVQVDPIVALSLSVMMIVEILRYIRKMTENTGVCSQGMEQKFLTQEEADLCV